MRQGSKSIIIISFISIFLSLIFFYAVPKSGEIALAKFEKFNSARIDGEITTLISEKSGMSFLIRGDNKEYKFIPHSTYHKGQKVIFRSIAKKGDSIHKSAYSDTLTLVSGEERYAFSFRKFE